MSIMRIYQRTNRGKRRYVLVEKEYTPEELNKYKLVKVWEIPNAYQCLYEIIIGISKEHSRNKRCRNKIPYVELPEGTEVPYYPEIKEEIDKRKEEIEKIKRDKQRLYDFAVATNNPDYMDITNRISCTSRTER